LLKGHERAITAVKYNSDGDLLFTAAKDNKPTVWYSDSGERLGTYGHNFRFYYFCCFMLY
jgi:translation initiation factor 3 subunit I